MTDVMKQIHETDEMTKDFSPEFLDYLRKEYAKNPKLKLIVPTPGTEPKLNGITVDDIEEVLAGFENGHPLKKKELAEALNANSKSSKDMGKINKLLPEVSGLQVTKGTRGTMTVQHLSGPTDNNNDSNGTKKK